MGEGPIDNESGLLLPLGVLKMNSSDGETSNVIANGILVTSILRLLVTSST